MVVFLCCIRILVFDDGFAERILPLKVLHSHLVIVSV